MAERVRNRGGTRLGRKKMAFEEVFRLAISLVLKGSKRRLDKVETACAQLSIC